MDFPDITVMLLILTWQQLSAQEACIDQYGLSNHTIEFSMVRSRNQTGHWSNQFSMEKTSDKQSKSWKVNLKQSSIYSGETHSFRIVGTIIVPPPKPEDYELFHGIGYYKFHYDKKVIFTEAMSICAQEGGYLAIINSEEEYNVIKTIYARNIKEGGPWSFIGFYDRDKGKGSRNFVTIFGEPVKSTGFNKWHGNEPNNIGGVQFCGCVISDGLLADVGCNDLLSFFCEYDLSWNELSPM